MTATRPVGRHAAPPSAGSVARAQVARLYVPSLFGGLIGKLGPFAAMFVLAWFLSAREFGLLAAAMLVSQSVSGLFVASILPTVNRSAAGRSAAQSGESFAEVMRGPRRVALAASLLGLVLAAPAVALLSGAPLDWRFALMGVCTGGPVLLETALSVHAGHGRTVEAASGEIMSGVVGAVLTLVGGLVWGAWGAATGAMVASCLVAAYLLARMPKVQSTQRDSLRSSVHHRRREDSRVTQLSVFGNLVVQVGLWSVQLVLSRSHGLEALGAFGLANRFAMAALLLPTFLTRNLVGLLSRRVHAGEWSEFRTDLVRYTVIATGLSVTAGAVAFGASRLLFPSVFDKYVGSSSFLLILLLASLPAALNTAFGVALIAQGSWRDWVVTDALFAAATVAWALGCLAVDASPSIVLLALPVGYILLALSRGLIIGRSTRTHTRLQAT